MATAPPQRQLALPPTSESSPPSNGVSWEGDKMFHIYIYDYCKKRGYHKTAQELVNEAEISPDPQPPINAPQGLLFEWWSVFWVLFQAKNSGQGSEDGLLYVQNPLQRQQVLQQQQAQRAGAPPNAQQPGGPRFTPSAVNGLPRPPPGSLPPPNGQMMNGVVPGGQPPIPGPNPPGFQMPPGAPQPNGIPVPQGPPGSAPGQNFAPPPPQQQQQQPGQPGPGGHPGAGPQRGPPMQGGPQHRGPPNGAGQPFQSPTMAPSPHPSQQGQPPHGTAPQTPQMHHANRPMGTMPPPNGPGPHPQGPQQQQSQQQIGSAHPTPTQTFAQIGGSSSHGGRPPSRQDTPSSQGHGGMHVPQSPSMRAFNPSEAQIAKDFSAISPELMGAAKLEAGIGEKDASVLTVDEMSKVLTIARRIRAKNGMAQNSQPGPSGHMQPPPNRTPQQTQQQLGPGNMPQPYPPQQRGSKRSSTSPGEEHEQLPRTDASPPERKRVRRTPNPAEPPPMQPMQPMGGPFAPPGGPGGPGPQGMSNGLPPGGMPNGIRQHPGGPGPGPGQMGGPGPQMGGPGGQQQPGMQPFPGQPGPSHMMKMQSGAMAGVGGGMGIGGGMGLPPNIGAPMHPMSSPMAPHPGAPGMMQQGMQQGQPMQFPGPQQYRNEMVNIHKHGLNQGGLQGMMQGMNAGSPSSNDFNHMMRTGQQPGPPQPGRMPPQQQQQQKGPMPGGMHPPNQPMPGQGQGQGGQGQNKKPDGEEMGSGGPGGPSGLHNNGGPQNPQQHQQQQQQQPPTPASAPPSMSAPSPSALLNGSGGGMGGPPTRPATASTTGPPGSGGPGPGAGGMGGGAGAGSFGMGMDLGGGAGGVNGDLSSLFSNNDFLSEFPDLTFDTDSFGEFSSWVNSDDLGISTMK